MDKRIISVLLCAALAASVTACGATDSSDEKTSKSSKDTSSAETAAEGSEDEAESLDAKGSTTTTAATTTTTSGETEPSEEPAASEPSAPEPADNDQYTVQGTGYTIQLSDKWMDAAKYQDTIKEIGQDLADEQFGMDLSGNANYDMIYMYDDGDLSDGVPSFNIVISEYRESYQKENFETIAETMEKYAEAMYSQMDGITYLDHGIVTLGENDYLAHDLITEWNIDGEVFETTANQFYTVANGYSYTITFSTESSVNTTFKKEFVAALETLKFTEE